MASLTADPLWEHLWNHFWNIYGTFMEHLWDNFYLWNIYGTWIYGTRFLREGCHFFGFMELWIYGTFMEHLWNLFFDKKLSKILKNFVKLCKIL